MDASESVDDAMPIFYVGQHESKRSLPITGAVLQQAHDCNYDMLTTPITTPHFHSRVLSSLSSHISRLQSYGSIGTFQLWQTEIPLIIPALSPVDTPLSPDDTISQLLAVSSPWIDLCSPDPLIADVSRQILQLEVAYAAFCNVRNVLIPGPKLHHGKSQHDGLLQYSRAVQDALNAGQYIQIQIWLPVVDHPDLDPDEGLGHLSSFAREQFVGDLDDDRSRKVDLFGTWDAWNVIRSICKYNSRLFVALSLPKQLPPYPVQSRWHSEPIQIISLQATSFLKNPKGYPVLSKPHQSLIHKYMRLRAPPWILLCDVGPIPGLHEPDSIIPMSDGYLSPSKTADAVATNGSTSPTPAEASMMKSQHRKKHDDPTPHLSYVRNLQRKQPPRTPLERFGGPIYQDYLQAPLQPLTVNLESLTYEVFEQDPVKYDWYEKGIARALSDWVEQGKPTSSPDGCVVIAVVGAGRGPLVTRALRASEETGVDVEVWAVEKNPNAFVLLQRHNELTWGGRVNVIQSDMRSWKGPQREGIATMVPAAAKHPPTNLPGVAVTSDSDPGSSEYTDEGNGMPLDPIHVNHTTHTPIDIVVSELLGSFGDNELSPECLDGIVHLLNPTHGISIPSSYSAHLTPISAPRLHADIASRTASDPTAPETPYVVWLHAIDYLSTTPTPSLRPQSTSASTTQPKGKSKEASTPGSPSAPSPTPPNPTQLPPTPLIQTAWSFYHAPSPTALTTPTNVHNMRSCRLSFRTPYHGLLHGLAGYFTTVLYASTSTTDSGSIPIELTTNPTTMPAKSPNMISWFPIFFPLKTPLWVPDNGELEVGMWRCTDGRKVWYEWCVEVWKWEGWGVGAGAEGGRGSMLVEGDGDDGVPRDRRRRVRVGMSELHSSVKGACLM